VQAKATAAERRASETESEMLLLGRSLRDAEAAVVEWQVRVQLHGWRDLYILLPRICRACGRAVVHAHAWLCVRASYSSVCLSALDRFVPGRLKTRARS
jgi:hypothetical protein